MALTSLQFAFFIVVCHAHFDYYHTRLNAPRHSHYETAGSVYLSTGKVNTMSEGHTFTPSTSQDLHREIVLNANTALKKTTSRFTTQSLEHHEIAILVKLSGGTQEVLAQFENDMTGKISHFEYIPINTVLVHGTLSAVEAVLALPYTVWAGPLLPTNKLDVVLQRRCGVKPGNVLSNDELYRGGAHEYSRLLITLRTGNVESVIQDWLRAARPERWNFTVIDAWEGTQRGHVVIVQCGSDCCAAAAVVAHHLSVAHIEYTVNMKPKNKYSRGLLQTGKPHVEPFTNAGLLGTDEVVGISDTGIDSDHCMFFDEKVPTPFDSVSYTHRKIISYITSPGAYGRGDGYEGHGTHVAGTVAGIHQTDDSPTNTYKGIASGAKVVFTDLNGGGDAESVSMPWGGLAASLFQKHYNLGAKVQTASWGGAMGVYNSYCREADDFASTKNDFVFHAAAGNEADIQCDSDYTRAECDSRTVMSPCTSKNTVCVGASQGPYESWVEMHQGNEYMKLPLDNDKRVKIVRAYFSTLPSESFKAEMVVSDPLLACEPIQNNIEGKIVLIKRGTCHFTDKVQRAIDKKARVVFIMNQEPGDPIIMGADDKNFKMEMAAYMVNKEDGEYLQRFATAHPDEYVLLPFVDNSYDPKKNEKNIASFSSRGPTTDYRIKPDVVAPGEFVFSAKSDGLLSSFNCDLEDQMGTSMATPAVAAYSTLVQSYFKQGWYPGGARNSGPALPISGALTRAIVVNSAEPLLGQVDRNAKGDWLNLTAVPNYYQGHGFPVLSTVLPLKGSTDNVEIFFKDGIGAPKEHQFDSYCVRFRGAGSSFKVTLAWTETSASASSYQQLLNDLNLEVIGPDDVPYFGNVRTTDPYPSWDSRNTIEKVRVENARAGLYRILVFTQSLAQAQKYSLTATGTDGGASCRSVACAQGCSGHGECYDGMCTCTLPYLGADCSMKATSLDRRQGVDGLNYVAAANGTTPVGVWKVFQYMTDDNPKSVSVKMVRLDTHSEPNLYVRKEILPTLREYDASATDCDVCRPGIVSTATITFSKEQTEKTAILIGVYVQCCHESMFKIDVTETLWGLPTAEVTGVSFDGISPANEVAFRRPFPTIPPSLFIHGTRLNSKCTVKIGSSDCSVDDGSDDVRLICTLDTTLTGRALPISVTCNSVLVPTSAVVNILDSVGASEPSIHGISNTPSSYTPMLLRLPQDAADINLIFYINGSNLCLKAGSAVTVVIFPVSEAPPNMFGGIKEGGTGENNYTICTVTTCTTTAIRCKPASGTRNMCTEQPCAFMFAFGSSGTVERSSFMVQWAGRAVVSSLVVTKLGIAKNYSVYRGNYMEAKNGGVAIMLLGSNLVVPGKDTSIIIDGKTCNTKTAQENLLICTTPAGLSTQKSLLITLLIGSDRYSIPETVASLYFAGAPSVYGVTVGDPVQPPRVNVVIPPYACEEECSIFFIGSNLGWNSSLVMATFTNSSSNLFFQVTCSQWSEGAVVRCPLKRVTSPGILRAQLTVDSIPTAFEATLQVATAPKVNSVTLELNGDLGPTDVLKNDIALPRSGNSLGVLVIHGSNLGAELILEDIDITLGDKSDNYYQCIATRASSSELSCVLYLIPKFVVIQSATTVYLTLQFTYSRKIESPPFNIPLKAYFTNLCYTEGQKCNSGTCIPDGSGYMCKCDPEYIGSDCLESFSQYFLRPRSPLCIMGNFTALHRWRAHRVYYKEPSVKRCLPANITVKARKRRGTVSPSGHVQLTCSYSGGQTVFAFKWDWDTTLTAQPTVGAPGGEPVRGMCNLTCVLSTPEYDVVIGSATEQNPFEYSFGMVLDGADPSKLDAVTDVCLPSPTVASPTHLDPDPKDERRKKIAIAVSIGVISCALLCALGAGLHYLLYVRNAHRELREDEHGDDVFGDIDAKGQPSNSQHVNALYSDSEASPNVEPQESKR